MYPNLQKTEKIFDLFNHHFYNDEMARPAITVSPDGGHDAYGWCSVYEIWQGNGAVYREINICVEYIDRPIGEVPATMLHEMAHLYDLVNGIKKPARKGKGKKGSRQIVLILFSPTPWQQTCVLL